MVEQQSNQTQNLGPAPLALKAYYDLSRTTRLKRLTNTTADDVIASLKLGAQYLDISEKTIGKYHSARIAPNVDGTAFLDQSYKGPYPTIWIGGYNKNVPMVKRLRYLKVRK